MHKVLDNNIIQHEDTRLDSYKLVEPKMTAQEDKVLQCIGMGINHPHAVVEHTGMPLRSVARAFTDLEDKCKIIRMEKTVYWKPTNRKVLQYRKTTDFEKAQYRKNQLALFDK